MDRQEILRIEDVRKTIDFLHPEKEVFEICGFDRSGKPICGWFKDREKALSEVQRINYDSSLKATYVSVNPCHDALLSKSNEKIKNVKSRTADKDVFCTNNLFIDVDPIRPADTNSSDEEHNLALETARHIMSDLKDRGWPDPLFGDSGNGAGLTYKLPKLPNTDDTKNLLKAILEAVAQKSDSQKIHIDQKVFNASRIMKLYGTMTRKGDPTPDRPQRISRIISLPKETNHVTLEQLKALTGADRQETPQAIETGTGKLDIPAYLSHYNIEVIKEKKHGDSTLYCLKECLFDPSHAPNESAIVQGGNGTLSYQCFHESCREKTWREARDIISGSNQLKPFLQGKDRGENLNQKEKTKSPSQAVKLITIASTYKLFHDDTKEAYAQVGSEILKIRGSSFKQCLARQLWQAENKAPNSDALNQALNVIEAQAIFDGACIKLFNRVAAHEGNFYYDLGNGKAVGITPEGWTIQDAPILFKRYSHQEEQVIPSQGGNPWEVFRFLNVDKEHQLLVLVYIICCLIPDIPHPISHPHGPQGGGKTTFCRVIKKLVDPSALETLITPKDMNQLIQVVAHHHVCFFDNLSDLPPWMSDILAQACTGGGFSKRQLYTDDEDVIYRVKRCLGINGINLLISRADLMDRAILLHLDRIEPTKRMDEKLFWENFQKRSGYILGGILDTLSKAMAIYPSVKLDQLPRMADFVKWGYAITEALGEPGDEFLASYQKNIVKQNEEVIQNNTLAQAVLRLMPDRESWTGTVKGAWQALSEIAKPEKADSSFPKSERTLRKHLERIKPNLLDSGVAFSIGMRNKDGFPITFQKVRDFTASASSSSESSNIRCSRDVHNGEDNEDSPNSNTQKNPIFNKENADGEPNVHEKHTHWECEIPVVDGKLA